MKGTTKPRYTTILQASHTEEGKKGTSKRASREFSS